MSFVDDVSYEESDGFQRQDLTPYREVFDNLKPNVTATIVVPTGEIITEGPHKGRGKTELEHEAGFRKVAKERGVGLRAGSSQMPNEKTRLRVMTQPKREFPKEAQAKRDASLALYRENQAAKKFMIEHPEWSDEQARKHYRQIVAARKAAAEKEKNSTK